MSVCGCEFAAPRCDCLDYPERMRPWWLQGKHQLYKGTGRGTLYTPPPLGAAGSAARSTLQSW